VGSSQGRTCAIVSGKPEEVTNGSTMHARCNDQKGCEAAHEGLRRVPENGRHVGAPEDVSRVRARRLLRLVEEPSRARTFS